MSYKVGNFFLDLVPFYSNLEEFLNSLSWNKVLLHDILLPEQGIIIPTEYGSLNKVIETLRRMGREELFDRGLVVIITNERRWLLTKLAYA